MTFKATLHVVKTRACYNILLGRRWLHDYAIVLSTLHQCFKYIDDDGNVHRVFADAKPFKGKEVYFPDAAMYEKRRSGVKKPTMETNTAESFKAISQWQKEKLAVRLTDKPKPFKVKVKPVMEKNKPLIISTKSSKSVNVASPEDCLHQGVRWSDLSWALTANGQVPRDCSGIGYHESKIYSLASQRIYGLMMGKIENYR
ncbi:hypothetical protein AAC387_Pa01g2181 [Persea americana]